MRAAFLAFCAASLVHLAPADAKTSGPSLIVLDFTAPAEYAEQARSLTALITADLAQHPELKLVSTADVRQMLGVARQQELLGCSNDACYAEIAGAMGARYILSGQLARFGSKFLLTASVVDSGTARSAAKSAQTVDSEEQLPAGAQAIAADVAAGIGLSAAPAVEKPLEPTVGLDFKLGNSLSELEGLASLKLGDFALRLDVEVEYFVTPSIVPLAVVSLVLDRAANQENVQFVPVLLGAKYIFRPGASLRPYAGGGLGLGFLFGGASSTSAAVDLMGGLAWIPFRHVGFTLEGNAGLSGVHVSTQNGLLLSFDLNLGVLVLI